MIGDANLDASSPVLMRLGPSVAVITLQRPDLANALQPEDVIRILDHLDTLESDPVMRCLILTGSGTVFSAGFDLRSLAEVAGKGGAEFARMVDRVEGSRLFTLAALNGPAIGGAADLALACDMIVAARNSVFVMAYSGIALSPDGGGSWSLSRAVPRQLATELLMCGERIGAERLQQLGVVNRLTDAGQALDEALKLADQINARAPNALASIKELLSDADDSTLNAQLARERDHFVKNLHHNNAGIGIAAFLNKQKPQYE